MGFYVTCAYCGAEEKGCHPHCGCIDKQMEFLVKKIIGATVISCCVITDDEIGGKYQFTKYLKDGQQFCTCNTLVKCYYSANGDEVFGECSVEHYPKSGGKGVSLVCGILDPPAESDAEAK